MFIRYAKKKKGSTNRDRYNIMVLSYSTTVVIQVQDSPLFLFFVESKLKTPVDVQYSS